MFDAADPVHPVGAAAGIRDFGAAAFPGISIRPFIELALSVTCSVGSEVAEETPEAQTLCLVVSQSGETADVLHAVESGAVAESPLLVLTNNAHSTLARRADAVVTSAAGPEIAVASTKTFVCQIVAGAALMISARVAMDRIARISAVGLVEDLRRVPDQLAAACTTARCVVPPIAEELTTAGGFVFIARGTGLPYAAEGALKLKEMTYRWADHYPAGELKHGPLALISTGTPVVVIDNAHPKLGANVAEVPARGGHTISIGPGPVAPFPWWTARMRRGSARDRRSTADPGPDTRAAFGRDIDKPRNLAKSVTVE